MTNESFFSPSSYHYESPREERIANAFAFIIDALIDEDTTLDQLIDLDEMTIEEFGEDYDFNRSHWTFALHLIKMIQDENNARTRTNKH